MRENETSKEHTTRRAFEWLSAGVVGLFSGFSGIASQTHSQFRGKLINYVRSSRWGLGSITLPNGQTADLQGPLEASHPELHSTYAKMDIKAKVTAHGHILDQIADDRIDRRRTVGNYLKDSFGQKNINSNALNEFAEKELEIATKGTKGLFQGTLQRFQFMGNHTRTPILINAAIATTVGVAGTMMFFNSLNTHNKLDELVNDKNQRKS